jgi:catechol 2,3-dioxygenase-like lactoylglutathione lyase family enzyme
MIDHAAVNVSDLEAS